MANPLAMQELEAPVPQKDAHRGRVISFERLLASTGTTGIQINLQSTDTGQDGIGFNNRVWLPRSFVENVDVDPTTLGEKEAFSYKLGIANSAGTATIQSIINVAKEEREVEETPFTSIDELVEWLNSQVAGVELVFARRPEKNEDGISYLQVKNFYPVAVAEDPRRLKGYRKHWEEEA